jgi:hypothetical protein
MTTSETMAQQFAAKCAREDEVLYYEFDPKATEDQDGDVHITTFSDGSKFYNDAATAKTWTTES